MDLFGAVFLPAPSDGGLRVPQRGQPSSARPPRTRASAPGPSRCGLGPAGQRYTGPSQCERPAQSSPPRFTPQSPCRAVSTVSSADESETK